MTNVISTAPRSRRRTGLAMVAAAVLSAAAFLTMSPSGASADTLQCPEGEFCLYFGKSLQNGMYHFSGRDSNLGNDEFEDGLGDDVAVADSAESAWNNGADDPRGREHVAVYTRKRFKGKAACIPREEGGDLRLGGENREQFFNNVASYRWINTNTCNKLSSALAEPGSRP